MTAADRIRHRILTWISLAAAAVVLSGCVVSSPPHEAIAPGAVVVPTSAADVRLQQQITPITGGRIAWAALGQGDPIVVLNGTGSPMAEWDPALLAALARTHRVLVFDYPGLGASTPLRSRLSFDRLADRVADWLAAIDVRSAHLLGWSMGTFVAQRLAVRHPQVVSRMTLVGGNPGGSATTLGPRWVQRADSDPDAGTRTYLRTNYPADPCAQAAGRAFLRRQAAAVESGRYPPDRVPARTYDAMVAAEDPWLRSDRNLRQLRTLSMPTLVLAGAADVITPPANSRALAAAIPDAVLRVVTVAGHSVLFQDPDLVATLVAQFERGKLSARPITVTSECS